MKLDEKALAIESMARIEHKPAAKLTRGTFRAISTAWPVYLFITAFICHVLGMRIYSYFNVWLKSTKYWSVEEINFIPTAGYGLQIFFTVLYAWTSDALRVRSPIIVFASFIALTGRIILSVWPSHNLPAMMTGWFLTHCETGAGALFITWINEVCGFSQEHRLIVIAVVETFAFTSDELIKLIASKVASLGSRSLDHICRKGMIPQLMIMLRRWTMSSCWRERTLWALDRIQVKGTQANLWLGLIWIRAMLAS
jgi:ACS family pantothenate transporter-like MFS transporter